MIAAALLTRLGALGVSVTADGINLRLRPAAAIPADMLVDLRAHKADLLALLSANDRDAWGLTAGERTEALELETADLPSGGPDTAEETLAVRAAWLAAQAIEALDGYEAPEPEPDWPAHEREQPQSLNRTKIVAGYLQAARQRPSSWADPTARPSPGCFCSCCRGQRWWREREAPKGWRCWACHPPDHLKPDVVREVRT